MPDSIISRDETAGLLTVYFKSFFVWFSQILEYVIENLPDPLPEEILRIFGDGEEFRARFIAFVSQTVSERIELKDSSIPLFTLREEYAFLLEELIPVIVHDAPRDVLLNMHGRMPFTKIASIPDSVPSMSLTGLLLTDKQTWREFMAWEAVVSDVARSLSVSVTDVFVLQGARDEVTRRRISRQEYMDIFADIIRTVFVKPSDARPQLIAIHLFLMGAELGSDSAYAEAERHVDENIPRYIRNAKAARDAVIAFLSEERRRIYGS